MEEGPLTSEEGEEVVEVEEASWALVSTRTSLEKRWGRGGVQIRATTFDLESRGPWDRSWNGAIGAALG